MNYLLSLILLNPLEALVIILGCNIISGIKFDLKKDIKYIYLLSSINFIIQVLLNLLNYNIFSLFLNIIIPFLIAPLIIKMIYNQYIGCIKYYQALIVQIFYMTTMTLTIVIFNYIFDNKIYTTQYINIIADVIVNISKTIFQLLLLNIYRGIISNEECKRDS